MCLNINCNNIYMSSLLEDVSEKSMTTASKDFFVLCLASQNVIGTRKLNPLHNMNNEAENISLSKTVFLRSVTQCALSGFLHFKKPELRKPISSELQAIFDEGTYVGKVARDLFRGGIDVI